MHTIEAIDWLQRLLRRHARPVSVIAVDGHSAAGKSTFARELTGRFGAVRVRGDDFYRVMEPADRAALTPEEGAHRYYDWERMLDEAIKPLRAGRPASYRPYDWTLNCLAELSTTIEPAAIVVVEGLFVGRPELDDVVDISVVVAADPSVRHERQLERRDATEEWLQRWDAAERWYFDHVRSPDSFDLIVNDASHHEADPGIVGRPSSK